MFYRDKQNEHFMFNNGNECGKYTSNENFKTTIATKNYHRPKTARECGIF